MFLQIELSGLLFHNVKVMYLILAIFFYRPTYIHIRWRSACTTGRLMVSYIVAKISMKITFLFLQNFYLKFQVLSRMREGALKSLLRYKIISRKDIYSVYVGMLKGNLFLFQGILSENINKMNLIELYEKNITPENIVLIIICPVQQSLGSVRGI